MVTVQTVPGGIRKIGWNRLYIEAPYDWDNIVKGNRHLLIEKDFTQLIEVRWELQGPGSIKTLLRNIRKSGISPPGFEPVQIPLPQPFRTLHKSKSALGISWDEEQNLSAISWRYDHSNAVVLCLIHRHALSVAHQLSTVLESIHLVDKDESYLWAVQDFRLHLPATYELTDHTFSPGLTRLGFRGDKTQLQVCRLASASSRLSNQPLAHNLKTLMGHQEDLEVVTATEQLCEYANDPSIGRQLALRLRRKPPFCWGRIWHLPAHDRLLAVTAESRYPIDLNEMHDLCNQYETL